ncbi:hypothetical protein [Spirillospora sp. CA-294931]|uniref:hypothetical protein n=1 Tax=Spirillospora sp. CA-294931 TaxID=3240042 RepID=UPI003D8D9521
MAIKEWLVFEAVCDGCDEVHDAADSFSEEEALIRAEAAGWVRTANEIHCSPCARRLVTA